MQPDTARAALAFLSRADLKGHEVDAFLTVCAALRALAAPPAPRKKIAVENRA